MDTGEPQTRRQTWMKEPEPATGRPAAPLEAAVKVRSGVVVLSLTGPVDLDAVHLSQRALEAAIRLRVPVVILDLEAATITEQAQDVLDLLQRRAATHGVELWTAGRAAGPAGRSAGPAGRAHSSVRAALVELARTRHPGHLPRQARPSAHIWPPG